MVCLAVVFCISTRSIHYTTTNREPETEKSNLAHISQLHKVREHRARPISRPHFNSSQYKMGYGKTIRTTEWMCAVANNVQWSRNISQLNSFCCWVWIFLGEYCECFLNVKGFCILACGAARKQFYLTANMVRENLSVAKGIYHRGIWRIWSGFRAAYVCFCYMAIIVVSPGCCFFNQCNAICFKYF